MNIFAVDHDPVVAARALCDKHVVKMPLETAQLLCAVAHKNGIIDVPYKLTHKNHPCTVWAGTSKKNWAWTITHGIALCDEYTRRYKRVHKSRNVILWCAANDHVMQHNAQDSTPHVQCMPEVYRHADNPVAAYRAYYQHEKAKIAQWKYSQSPQWWNV